MSYFKPTATLNICLGKNGNFIATTVSFLHSISAEICFGKKTEVVQKTEVCPYSLYLRILTACIYPSSFMFYKKIPI